MDVKEIKELLKAFDESDSSYLRIKQDGVDIRLRKPDDVKQVVVAAPQTSVVNPAAVQVEAAAAEPVSTSESSVEEKQQPVDGEIVKAPLVGVFYSAPSPEEKPYVQVGDSVKEGQVLCLIEAMKMMSEITSPKDGVVKEIYAKNQDIVEFEQNLFCIGE
ncbi:acetyl-CoA carboxylase biotin carboxyl carrier protein [Pseudobutyrivibrio sp. ACV-2]|uniref:acetyl-CoA carboxylase biotin carboxyl carrier protein n=1 Tax=Pseudobutyrivibrio sp. ACV-2 TaxID=1520801 RepID=UPI00089D4FF3|nr:acetyl-CoA carboxylase biotin carboxyl carrier protein [Pseudobutyrivibrio sp. ACV-2]SEA27381.1 acetyl-CoA carboxylase biotin carboxyl carrier protein [Pseudobutyrivibrio sp. ACV-2]